jgi:hypothetical protein
MPSVRVALGFGVFVLIAGSAAAQTPPGQAAEQKPLNPTQEIAREQAEGPALEAGPARIRIGGYVGVHGIYRSTNSGGGVGTSFASIPYADTVRGNVSEARLSAQASRLSIRVDADFPPGPDGPRFRRLSGYFEMDFAGSTPGNIAVTTSGAGFRLRLAFAEVQYRQTVFLAAGQAFSLMTAPKDQLSLWPGDIELTQAVDLNYVAGMVWNRSPQVRLTWRPSRRFNWAASVENPEQQLGSGVVTLPQCCAADIDAQYNTGADELRAPNLMPDFSTRVTYSPRNAIHIDAGGALRVFRHTVAPYDEDFKATGGGGSVNIRVNATSSTKILGQVAIGSGMGRYIGGLVPDAAFRSDGSISLIETTSWVGGVEQTLTPRASVAGYHSGVKAGNNSFTDLDGRFIGFGFPGSSTTNNRNVRELTLTGAYQIVRTPNRGSAQLNTQVSWLRREPWSAPASGLSSARSFMFLAQVRYNLP